MDTSEIYIKMCDCDEVKNMINQIIENDSRRKKETFKRFHNTKYCVRIPDIRTADVLLFDENNKPTYRVDLISQDQIQEMIGKIKPNYLIITLVTFMQNQQQFYKKRNPKKLYPTGSIEQIWLAFYMYEKHRKFWSQDKWIKK